MQHSKCVLWSWDTKHSSTPQLVLIIICFHGERMIKNQLRLVLVVSFRLFDCLIQTSPETHIGS